MNKKWNELRKIAKIIVWIYLQSYTYFFFPVVAWSAENKWYVSRDYYQLIAFFISFSSFTEPAIPSVIKSHATNMYPGTRVDFSTRP
jgi:hypothetical protein